MRSFMISPKPKIELVSRFKKAVYLKEHLEWPSMFVFTVNTSYAVCVHIEIKLKNLLRSFTIIHVVSKTKTDELRKLIYQFIHAYV